MKKCLQIQSNISCNWLTFLTTYFSKLTIKLVHLLKTKLLKLQKCTRLLPIDTKNIIFPGFPGRKKPSSPGKSLKSNYFPGFPR